ncbi:MAG: peptidylprolyl isomerase [Acidobacteriota bacterium]
MGLRQYMASLLLMGCATPAWPQAQVALPATDVEAVVTTDLGTFRFEFSSEKAPKHVGQFIARARQGYYDGSAFHRVVANGIIQGEGYG